ncbi:helix-turn-helix domain-containing protein [uncultured Desulfovibrio sp.]|uniref:helix-turn-helix domain-containing protein n=1 Tax=uncultured Desulfovibrio sp. TaxID=167968 RepID=UPI002635EAAE|nr:helix-turn-helix domain-containing protein [uncultured Desulfovibrio sp.]
MDDFSKRFEIIYQKFADWGVENGFKPSKLAFSRFLGVTQGAIQKWENGTIPSAKVVKTIHDKLGFAYDWLISGEGERFDSSAQKLAAQEAEIGRLRNRLLVDGVGDKDAQTSTGKAAGGQG